MILNAYSATRMLGAVAAVALSALTVGIPAHQAFADPAATPAAQPPPAAAPVAPPAPAAPATPEAPAAADPQAAGAPAPAGAAPAPSTAQPKPGTDLPGRDSPAAKKAADAAAKQEEWPCIWRKTLSLDAATIWDGPEIDPESSAWRKDDAIRKLSEYLVARRIKVEEAEAAIKKYAESQPADVRDQKLTELFTGVLARTNEDRRTVMSGIERFHKRQMARAKEIEKQGVVLPPPGEAVPATPTTATEINKISDAEERYNWEVRVFQERQQNIPLACEIPQLMDERAGAVARAIRAEMKT